jgi:SAM-dependent methyltransferase
MASDATTRFTSRVADYIRYRPGYPKKVLETLGIRPGTVVADVGSGTGILTRMLLDAGASVFAIEPNDAMREAAESLLSDREGFVSVRGTAEATGLADASVDLVVAAQAFHWFDVPTARREFRRILREPPRVALIWNERIEEGTPFLEGFEAILRKYATDYLAVRHNAIAEADLQGFFGGTMETAEFPNAQRFDYEGVVGRLMSSSYAPRADDLRHAPMLEALRRLFDATAEDETAEFIYVTRVYSGTLG